LPQQLISDAWIGGSVFANRRQDTDIADGIRSR
jgi:hypothetical protein